MCKSDMEELGYEEALSETPKKKSKKVEVEAEEVEETPAE